MKLRLQNIDLIKLFAIYLVILGHVLMHLRTNESYQNELFLAIYSFHMPLFMALVGYFAQPSLELNGRSFFKKKTRQLILPTITWCITFWIFNFIILKYDEYLSLKYIYNSTFWFLKSAFLCYGLFYLGYKISHNLILGCILTLVLSQMFPFFDIGRMYPSFLIGVLLAYKGNKLSNVPFIFIFIGIFCFFVTYFNVDVRDSLIARINPIKSLINGISIIEELPNYLIGLGIGILATVVIILLSFSSFFKKFIHQTSSICKYGQYTLGVYCVQTFLLEIMIKRWVSFDSIHHATFTYIISPLIAIVILIVCINIVMFMSKNKYLKFIFLGGSSPFIHIDNQFSKKN